MHQEQFHSSNSISEIHILKNIFLAFILLFITSSTAFGQWAPTNPGHSDVQIGGAFATGDQDLPAKHENGYSIYGDLDFKQHLGIEVNYVHFKNGDGSYKEKSANFGVRYFHDYGIFRPYAKILYGKGGVNYPGYSYAGDNILGYGILNFGAGVDVDLHHHITGRADYTFQKWFSGNDVPGGVGAQVFTAGAAYHFNLNLRHVGHALYNKNEY